MTNARFDQALAEELTTGSPKARFDQALAEEVTVGSPNARVNQSLVEIIFAQPSYPVIPTLAFPTISALNGAAQGWSVHRRPTLSTRRPKAVSGRDVRTPLFATAMYEFDLTFDGLKSGANNFGALPAYSLELLMGFFLQAQGQYASFLFTDPDFYQQLGGPLGTGDGVTTTFALQRLVGTFAEVIQAANVVSTVYVNGVAASGSTWSVANGNQIVFTTAPAAGAVLTADFTYYFVCAFDDDVQDFEEFMYQLHTLKSLKFTTVRTS